MTSRRSTAGRLGQSISQPRAGPSSSAPHSITGSTLKTHQHQQDQQQYAYMSQQHQAMVQHHQATLAGHGQVYPTAGSPSTIPFYTPLPPQSQPTPLSGPPLTANDIVDRLVTALTMHQQSTTTRLDQLGTSIETLNTQIGEVRKETQEQTKQFSGFLEKSQTIHQVACRILGGRLEQLETVIGTSYDRDQKKSLFQRLDGVSFAVEELLERARDPEAALEAPPPSDTVHHQIGTSPVSRTYVDVHIAPRTPSPFLEPKPLPGPDRISYEKGTSPLRKVYMNAATDPRTPTPPRSPSSITRSTSVGISPTPDADQSSIPPPRRYSDAVTLVGDISNPDLKPCIELTDDKEIGPDFRDFAIAREAKRHMVEGDTELVPEIERLASSPSSISLHLSPADFSSRHDHQPISPLPDPTRALRDSPTLLEDDEENFPVFDPSAISSGSQRRQGSVMSFVESLRHSALDFSVPLGEEEEEDEPEPETKFGDVGLSIGTEQHTATSAWSEHSDPSAPSAHRDVSRTPPQNTGVLSPSPRTPLSAPSSSRDTPLTEELFGCMEDISSLQKLGDDDSGVGCAGGGESESGAGSTVVPAKCADNSSVVPPITPTGPGDGEDLPALDSDEELSVSALITEALSSLPELENTIADVGSVSGTGGGRSEKSLSAEVPLPRSRPSGSRVDFPLPPSRPSKSRTREETPLFVGVRGPVFDSPPGVGFGRDVAVDKSGSSVPPMPTPRTMTPTPICAHPSLSTLDSPALKPFVTKSLFTLPPGLPGSRASASKPDPQPQTKLPYSPIYISSRSLSPISSLSSSDESSEEDQAVLGNSDDSDILVIPAKMKGKKAEGKNGSGKPKAGVRSTVTGMSGRDQLKSKARSRVEDGPTGPGASGSGLGSAPLETEVSAHRRKLLQLKLKAPDGQSAAVTRVKRRKVEKVEKPETMKTKDPVAGPRQSVAATRVKKRKVNEREMMMEPPLKRAKRLSASASASGNGKESRGSSSGDGVELSRTKGKGKETASPKKRGRPSKGKGIKWPAKMKTGEGRQKFAECVKCFRWYHYGCVGILPSDLNVGDFKCPPCQGGGANPLIAAKNAVICSRPGCSEQAQPGLFFVACILGRTAKVQGSHGQKCQWLLKWDGYPVDEATWEDEESMADPRKLIEDFRVAARKEGFEDDDSHSVILLKEAVEAGWKQRMETANV